MYNSYNRYNLNLYICVIVIVFNCTIHIYIHELYTNILNMRDRSNTTALEPRQKIVLAL